MLYIRIYNNLIWPCTEAQRKEEIIIIIVDLLYHCIATLKVRDRIYIDIYTAGDKY